MINDIREYHLDETMFWVCMVTERRILFNKDAKYYVQTLQVLTLRPSSSLL